MFWGKKRGIDQYFPKILCHIKRYDIDRICCIVIMEHSIMPLDVMLSCKSKL